jgi:predicted alpha/beta-hydrolase family hydrolase
VKALPNPNELAIQLESGAATTALHYEGVRHRGDSATVSDNAIDATLILGHGAGAGQRSAFMVDFAHALSALGIDVITFNFLYTEQGRRIPDRAPTLESCYRAVIETVYARVASARRALFIGGKSMGGRIATQVAAADPDLRLAGLVLLGYPLHPPGRPAERRDKHLPAIARPMLFVQGTRDAFGTPGELMPILATLQPKAELHVVDHGDHSFKLSRKDAAAQAAVYETIQQAIAAFIRSSAP